MKQWQETTRAVDLPTEALASIVDTLLKRLGLCIVCEQTPDYTMYELKTISGTKEEQS